ncbi:hypothetical protein NEOLEDRAFT_593819 [Neolentinus lepideus HHB14362 ss-1]|uniref:Uncharacterized protein n=1 Tax=Neolentinus lepideus HHB14362 ss-1 TaxID=1314782 RepID=A0A165V9B8_9AGAM|nr:hypothetical protein NEOLEDRAFT_593819 [Neolentinus lepideus HHB14362 ss-1]
MSNDAPSIHSIHLNGIDTFPPLFQHKIVHNVNYYDRTAYEYDPSVSGTSSSMYQPVPSSPEPQSLSSILPPNRVHRSHQHPYVGYIRPQTIAPLRGEMYNCLTAPPVPVLSAPPYLPPSHFTSDAQTHPLDMHRITSQGMGLPMARGWMPERMPSGNHNSMLANANMSMGNGVCYPSYPNALPGDSGVYAYDGPSHGAMVQGGYLAMEQYDGLNAGYPCYGWQ